MKVIIPTLALLCSVCLQADVTPPAVPPPATPPPPIISAGHADVPQAVNDAVEQALSKASQATSKAMAQAAKALDLAKAKIAMAAEDDGPEIMKLFRTDGEGGGFGEFLAAPGRAATQPLIIRTGDVDPTSVAELQEDLTVMSRIVTKTVEREVGREGHDAAMGIVLSALPGGRRPQSLYLEGYGALFLINVRFPLVPPAVKEEEKAEKPTDTTWERTKQELYGPKSSARIWSPALPGEAPVEYNSDQVEDLKKELIESIKNATNIRGLKPEESVTLAVIGPRGNGNYAQVKRMTKANARRADIVYTAGGRESILTLRVKKVDVDAYAKGSIDSEAFRKRVVVAAY